MIRYFLFCLFLSMGLSAQKFNRAKAYTFHYTPVSIDVFPNGDIISMTEGHSNIQIDLLSADGDSLAQHTLPFYGFSESNQILVLDSNLFALSYVDVGGCDFRNSEEHFLLLMDRSFTIVDSLHQSLVNPFGPSAMATYDQMIKGLGSQLLFKGPTRFSIVDYANQQLKAVFDTVFYPNLFISGLANLNADSVLISADTVAQSNTLLWVYRYSDSSFTKTGSYFGEEMVDFDSRFLAFQRYWGDDSLFLVSKQSLQIDTVYNLNWPASYYLYSKSLDGKILLWNQQNNYVVLDPSNLSFSDTGTFKANYALPERILDLALMGDYLYAFGRVGFGDLVWEKRRFMQPAAPYFSNFSFRLEALRSGSYDAIVYNNSSDTITKIGFGISTGGSAYYCQETVSRTIRDGLNLAPNDSLVLTFIGNPFYYDINSGASTIPFFAYMVNDLPLEPGDKLPTSTLLTNPELPLQAYKLYPNPIHDVLNLDLEGQFEFIGDVSIYSLSGKCLRRESLDTRIRSSHQIDLKDLSPGLYILELKAGSKSHQQKILKL